MDKDFECIVVDTNKEEYEFILPSDIFINGEQAIVNAIAEGLKKPKEDIKIDRIDAMVKISLKDRTNE
jgi:hypothetical protein